MPLDGASTGPDPIILIGLVVFPNHYSGECRDCHCKVAAEAGFAKRVGFGRRGRWDVWCNRCGLAHNAEVKRREKERDACLLT